MKICSKSILLLGGIYALLELPFIFLPNQLTRAISSIALILFLFFFVAVLFKKSPKFLDLIITKYPNLSIYLICLGWIPYITFFIFILLIASGYFVEFSTNTLNNIIMALQYLIWSFYVLDFVIATIKIVKTKKSI